MSNKAINYVWETPHSGAKKLMLVAIADQCNDEGFCWPSIGILARKCGIQESSARNMIYELERMGELGVEQGGLNHSDSRTNRYYLVKYRLQIGLSNDELTLRETKPSRKREAPENDRVNPQQNDTLTLQKTIGSTLQKTIPEPLEEPSSESTEEPTDCPTDKLIVETTAQLNLPVVDPLEVDQVIYATKDKPKHSRDYLFDVIAEVWKLNPNGKGGYIGQMKQFLTGQCGKDRGDWSKWQIDPPMTVEEIYGFGQWKADEGEIMVSVPQTINRSVMKFRDKRDYERYVTLGQRWLYHQQNPPPDLWAHQEMSRDEYIQAAQEHGETIVELTPEEQAAIDAALEAFGEKPQKDAA